MYAANPTCWILKGKLKWLPKSIAFVLLSLGGLDADNVLPFFRDLSIKLSFIAVFIFSLIFASAYNANLVSLLAVKKMDYPVSFIEDILREDNSHIRLGIMAGTSDQSYFEEAPAGSLLHEIWEKKSLLIDFPFNTVSNQIE